MSVPELAFYVIDKFLRDTFLLYIYSPCAQNEPSGVWGTSRIETAYY